MLPAFVQLTNDLDNRPVAPRLSCAWRQDSSGVVSPHEMNLAFSVRAPWPAEIVDGLSLGW